MSIFKASKPPQATPVGGPTPDPIEQNIEVADAATAEKDRVAESGEDDGKKTEEAKAKEKPKAELGNYFVSATSPQFD
jgi:hypothetical protein